MKDWPPAMKARVAYVEATEENMKEVEEEEEKEQKVSWSFWRFLLRRKQAAPGEKRNVNIWTVLICLCLLLIVLCPEM